MLTRLPSLILLLGASLAHAGSLEREMRQVEKIRGLEFRAPVQTVSVARDEVGKRLRSQITQSLPYSLDDYLLVLRALHLVDEYDQRVEQKLFTLLEQQVLAWYDPRSHTYYDIKDVPAAAALVPPSVIAIHELTHALQDQHFRIGERDRALRSDWDASMAYHAVIEGEATLVMLAAVLANAGVDLETLVSNDSVAAKLSDAAALTTAFAPDAPRYFVESLKFPYIAGLKLVLEAYRRGGGWKGIDALHENPPRSTREVLHPEEYFSRVSQPVIPSASEGSPAGWRRPGHEAWGSSPSTRLGMTRLLDRDRHGSLTSTRLGEFHWAFLLGEKNAYGWAHDEVSIVQNRQCEPTVLVSTVWDSPADASRFRDAYSDFLAERAPNARVVQIGASVRAAYGADRVLISGFAQ